MMDLPPTDSQIPTNAYLPGLWQQDVFTLPLGGALIFAMNQTYTKTAHPLFSWGSEIHPSGRNHSRHPKSLLAPVGVLWGGTLFAGLKLTNGDSFLVYSSLSGLAHTHIATEILTSFAKLSFQRPRPFVDAERAKGNPIGDDDRLSFFSGHSSHAFAFASYTTKLLWDNSSNLLANGLYTAFAASAATYIGSARVLDGKHNWSDVGVGAAVGTAAGILIRMQTKETEDVYLREGSSRNGQRNGLPSNSPETRTSSLVWMPYFSASGYGISLQLKL